MERIEINPKIMVGKPVIRGTRITVEYILELLGQGQTIEDITKEHPQLTKQDILAAIAYARGILGQEKVYPLPKAKA